MMNLRGYCAFAGMQDRNFLVDHLTSVLHSPPWSALDHPSFKRCYSEIKHAVADDPLLGQLVDLHLLTHRLIAGNRTPRWVADAMDEQIRPEKHFSDVKRRACLNGRWTVVPVPMLLAGRGRIRWFVVGCLDETPRTSLWPRWAAPLMDRDSQSAAQAAARAACAYAPSEGETSLFLFPLAMANDQCQFYGASLGLPLAIGFMAVLTGDPISTRLIATGTIKENASIGSIDGLGEKQTAAGRADFSLFIYPAANHPVPALDRMETLQVANLGQAWMLARWYRPGNGNRLALLSHMVDDAHAFVANMNTINSQWVRYLAAQGRLHPVLKKILASPDLFTRYMTNVENQLDDWRLDDAQTYLTAASADAMARDCQASPIAAFRYFKASLTLANHRGNVDAADTATVHADQRFDRAMQGDLNLCADYLNHRQVARHNRFLFTLGLDDQLQRVLQVLEARHQAQCEFGCPTDIILARVYGTIAQNFGFCGPAHLTQTIRYAEKAIQTFGGGEVSEYRQDVLRQYGYLMYAHLDAGDAPTARKNLLAFLAADDWTAIDRMREANRLSSWHHAALARFLADADDRDQAFDYLNWCRNQATIIEGSTHPRQLWAYNLGRMAQLLEQTDTAETFFRESLALCLADENSPTIFTMALLPLAALDGMEATVADKALIKIVETARRLNADHFKGLLDVDEKTLLQHLRTTPERYFPFSYR